MPTAKAQAMPWFTGWEWRPTSVGPASETGPLWPSLAFPGLQPAEDPPSFALAVPRALDRVRATPGAPPAAAASMDGPEGRAAGFPGGGKGLRCMPCSEQVVERQRLFALFYGFETLFGIERASRLELLPTVLRLCADCRGRIPPLQASSA